MRTQLIAILVTTLFTACTIEEAPPAAPPSGTAPTGPGSSGGGGGGGGGGIDAPDGGLNGSDGQNGSDGTAGGCVAQVSNGNETFEIVCDGISATEVSCQCIHDNDAVTTCTAPATTACSIVPGDPSANCCGYE